jgi:spore coat polysaccharide biosynthesis predicted glycosyltransferase SpsG
VAIEPGRAPRVAIGFGGSDPLGLTEPMLAALLEALPSAELDVMLGPGVASQRRERLLGSARSTPRANIHVDPAEIGSILLDADVLISAAGVTVWEALALGVPAVVVTVADNQRAVAEPVIARGAAIDGGWAGPDTARQTAQLARDLLGDAELRAKLSKAGRALIDGRGVWRAVDALLDTMDERAGKT